TGVLGCHLPQIGQAPIEDKWLAEVEGCETIRQGVAHLERGKRCGFEQGGVTRLTLFIAHRGQAMGDFIRPPALLLK
ncbi:hypothetical protein P4T95_21615, partial [Bacillus licheniformis]|uniref:hypothetical protein n=2 Tax=Bacillus licheniformis TaxID=1402 RepID=UPI002E21DD78|nr:hypothetical protein [Bacillus licheniformis]